jgi:transcriptional regulator with XRE-family HTH domain
MEELAEKADLTTVTIRHIESDAVTPQEKTLANILTVFDLQGIEFGEDEGVKIRRQSVRSYSGKAGYRQLLDHIYETLKNGGRICQFNFGDMRYLSYADDFIAEHIKRMATIEGLEARVLEREGDTEVPVSYCQYRTLPKIYGGMAPYYLYNDFLVQSLFETGNKREFITIHSKLLTERYVKQFDLFWERGEAPRKKRGK